MTERDPASTGTDHVAQQRDFYDTRPHHALQASADDRYAQKLAATLARRLGIQKHHRVLEVGAGFGRFTFWLLAHCGSLTALDLSQRALQALDSTRESRGIGADRCQTRHADLLRLEPDDLTAQYDFVVGFFVLHHLEDVEASLDRLSRLAAPGGGLAFLEPNRWNPLYLLQVAGCRDMAWSVEKGVWQLSAKAVEQSYRASGLEPISTHRFGFFPPQLVNRFEWARRLETRLERQRWLAGVLPFMILAARAPSGAGPGVPR